MEWNRDRELGLRSTPAPNPPGVGDGVAGTILIRVPPPNGCDQQAVPESFSSGSSPSDDMLVVLVDETPGVANEDDELNDLDNRVGLVFIPLDVVAQLESRFTAKYSPNPSSASSIRISLNTSSASSNKVAKRFSFSALVMSRTSVGTSRSGEVVSSYSIFGEV